MICVCSYVWDYKKLKNQNIYIDLSYDILSFGHNVEFEIHKYLLNLMMPIILWLMINFNIFWREKC